MYLAARAVLAQDAETEIEEEPEAGSSLGFSFAEGEESRRADSEEIDDLELDSASTLDVPIKATTLKLPFQVLQWYSNRAYLPPIARSVLKGLNSLEELLIQYPVNQGARTLAEMRSVVPFGKVYPTGGKRSLSEIERIDMDWLDRAAAKCECAIAPVVSSLSSVVHIRISADHCLDPARVFESRDRNADIVVYFSQG